MSGFNVNYTPINNIIEDENVLDVSRRDIKITSFKEMGESLPRDLIKEGECLEASYSKQAAFHHQKRLKELQKKEEGKKFVSVFGYKYPKSPKFYAFLLRCLKNCFQQKQEALNVDMNFFLLLKNELSLSFLRKFDNITQAVRAAIRVYAS